jgi:hypothetical protein
MYVCWACLNRKWFDAEEKLYEYNELCNKTAGLLLLTGVNKSIKMKTLSCHLEDVGTDGTKKMGLKDIGWKVCTVLNCLRAEFIDGSCEHDNEYSRPTTRSGKFLTNSTTNNSQKDSASWSYHDAIKSYGEA